MIREGEFSAATVGEAAMQAAAILADAGVGEPRLDARLLIAHALAISGSEMFARPERPIDDDERARIAALVARRRAREPLARIVGEREFWSLRFAVSADTLIPRPDSETLIEAVLEAFADDGRRREVLDLGTGSGCLMLALLYERQPWHGTGLDVSKDALVVAAANARSLGLDGRARFVHADWSDGLGQALAGARFDVIVCNPPYIADKNRDRLAPEVRLFEPAAALFAGADGLDAYRALIAETRAVLAPNGKLFLELGAGQLHDVSAILRGNGYGIGTVRRDLAGLERCVVAAI